MSAPLLIAKNNEVSSFILPKMANRQGLIPGATGNGKTVTLQSLADQFSCIGVPVFKADVKVYLAGMSQIGGGNPKVEARAIGSQLGRQIIRGVLGSLLGGRK